jgi:hypothetical protein
LKATFIYHETIAPRFVGDLAFPETPQVSFRRFCLSFAQYTDVCRPAVSEFVTSKLGINTLQG